MHTRHDAARRLLRGELAHPLRHWSAFALYSVIAHALMLAVLSHAALTFIENFPKPVPPREPLIYVGLLFPNPTPVGMARLPRAAVPDREARPAPRPVPKPAPKPVQAKRAASDVPETPRHRPVRAAAPIDAPKPTAVRPPEPELPPEDTLSIEAAEKSYTEYFEQERAVLTDAPEEDGIIVIRGTRKTMLAHADLPSAVKDNRPVPENVAEAAPEPPDEYAAPIAFPAPLKGLSMTALGLLALPETPAPFSSYSIPPLAAVKIEFAPDTSREGTAPEPRTIVVLDDTAEPEPPAVAITAPAEGETDRSLVDVTGEVYGDGIGSVSFMAGGRELELLVRDGKFSATAALTEGRNVLTAAATDRLGRTARARVVVVYAPLSTGPKIRFVNPADGGIIDAYAAREIEVSGKVEGPGVATVRIYLNSTVHDAAVTDGRFGIAVPPEMEQNRLYAEATDRYGVTSKSDEVRFKVVNLFPKDITVRVALSGGAGDIRLRHGWRPHPKGEDSRARGPEFDVDELDDGWTASVDEAAPGIYTVGVAWEMGPGEVAEATLDVTLFGHDPVRKKTRRLGPFRLAGKGYAPALRLLLPEGVYWEDDFWFSGMVETATGTTKFNQPEGVAWTEKD